MKKSIAFLIISSVFIALFFLGMAGVALLMAEMSLFYSFSALNNLSPAWIYLLMMLILLVVLLTDDSEATVALRKARNKSSSCN